MKADDSQAPHQRVVVAHVTAVDLSIRHLLLNQLCSLKEEGYEVWAISSPGPDVPHIEASGIRHVAVDISRSLTPLRDLVALWKLYRIMRRGHFSIIHGHTPKAELLAQVAARMAGVPVVVDTFRGVYFRRDMHRVWRWLSLQLARIAAACADLVLSQSREVMEMAIRERVCDRAKIRHLGNGIDVVYFNRRNVSGSVEVSLREELKIVADTPVVGFVGRLVAEKGVVALLRAFPRVRAVVPNAMLLMVGAVDHEKTDAVTPEKAAEFGVSEACVFTGFRTDTREMYALMDVFVLPSERESFPRSPMEAAAMGLPCVLSDIPGCREVVRQGRSGYLVSLDNPIELADRIITLLTDRTKARVMGDEGRRLSEEMFDERTVFSVVKGEYERLLHQKGLSTPMDRSPS